MNWRNARLRHVLALTATALWLAVEMPVLDPEKHIVGPASAVVAVVFAFLISTGVC